VSLDVATDGRGPIIVSSTVRARVFVGRFVRVLAAITYVFIENNVLSMRGPCVVQ
jgi:hypothetical protein